jgi:group I intron endonuclease
MRKLDTCSCIYCFENIIDSKKYIGQTQDINRRYKRHMRELENNKSNNVYFQKAWNKYGKDCFKFFIIEKCHIDLLDEREIYWIKELHSHSTESGYNISWGGITPMRNVIITDEHREKLRVALSGINNPMYGKRLSKETLDKISKALKGRVVSEESRKKASNSSSCKKNKNNKLGYIGITKDKHNYFIVRIVNPTNRNRIYLGYYSDIIEAAKTFDKSSWEFYHDLGKLNFPQDYQNGE